MKGRFHSLETRKKMSDNRKKENNSFWKGGLTYLQKLENIAGRKRPELCEICGKKGKICFDHNHETGKFRGWICVKCNIALGMSEDNPEILNKLIKYIEKNKE